MIELQCICACLDRKDFAMFKLNDITKEFFKDYLPEFEFIENHFNTYGNVPDVATFLNRFPDFKMIEVVETEKYLVDKLRENYVYNSSVKVLKDVAEKFKSIDSREAVAYLLSQMPELNKKLTFDAVDLISNFDKRYKKYEERSENPESSFILTGIKELDAVIGGFDAQDEDAIVTASTGVGKSFFSIFFGLSAAKQGKKVGYYSGEMSSEYVGWRLDTMYSHISNFALTRGYRNIKEAYRTALIKQRDEIKGKFYCVTPEEFGGSPTISKLSAFIEKYNLDMLIIDQLSLIKDSSNAFRRDESFANISKEIKMLQTMKKIPILSVVQLNRGAKDKDVEDPGTEHIAGSNRIIEDATLALSLKQKSPDAIEIRIMKARNCPSGLKLTYTWKVDTFELTYVPAEDDAYSKMGQNNEPQREYKEDKIVKEIDEKTDYSASDDYSGGDLF